MLKKLLSCLLFIFISISAQNKISVITTLFPLYDFTKTIVGNKGDVKLILPPAVEPHSFEPTPKDIGRINKANLFIYTSHEMEPWIVKLAKTTKSKVKLVESGKGLSDNNHVCDHAEHEGHSDHGTDPHIWLDPTKCLTIIDNICNELNKQDPTNKAIYTQNANKLKAELLILDKDIESVLSSCTSKTIYYAGHFAFGYFVERYDLNYETTYHGLSPDAEPSPKKMAQVIKTIKNSGTKAIFYEALTIPRLAKAISKETGAEMILLHSIANLSKDDFQENKTYISLMRSNLANLLKGLHCK